MRERGTKVMGKERERDEAELFPISVLTGGSNLLISSARKDGWKLKERKEN